MNAYLMDLREPVVADPYARLLCDGCEETVSEVEATVVLEPTRRWVSPGDLLSHTR